MLVLLGGALRSQAQSPYHVPLGSAAAYGLLSAGSLQAASPVQVIGKAGAGQSLDTPVTGSGGTFAQGSGTVPAALDDLQMARTYCTGLTGTSLAPQLGGQTLSGGVYYVGGNATLGSSGALTLTGTASTVVVLNIAGALNAQAGSQVVLAGVMPWHVYWNVDGSLTVGDQAAFRGVALVGGPAQVAGIQFGHCALLSQQGIALSGLSAVVGTNQFYGPGDDQVDCSSAACSYGLPANEMVSDGSFEMPRCLPQQLGGLRPHLLPSGSLVLSDACFWAAATSTSSDYFYANGRAYPDVDVPTNYFNQGSYAHPPAAVPALAQNSRLLNGKGYAGIVANVEPGYSGGVYREYVSQDLAGPITQGTWYYGEFSAYLSPTSSRTSPELGMALKPYTFPLPLGSSAPLYSSAYPTAVSGSPNLPLQLSTSAPKPGWKRVGQFFQASSTMLLPHLIVGNFSTAPDANNGPGTDPRHTYYYLDNVTLSVATEAGPDRTLVSDCTPPKATKLGTAPLPDMVGATYAWTATPADPNLTPNVANPTVAPAQTTTYTLTVTVPGVNAQLQTHTSSVTVTVISVYGQNAGANYVAPSGSLTYEIGQPGVVTTIDASLAPYTGQVVFDGRYHVRGTVRLLNGKFQMQPGTVFYVDGDSGIPASNTNPNAGRSTIYVDRATLTVDGATLQANTVCDPSGPWQGVVLAGKASLITRSPQGYRSSIQDADEGVHSSATNSYYVDQTDFRNNRVGFYDLVTGKTALKGEGITNCLFVGGTTNGDYGLVLFETDYLPPYPPVYGGDYTAATFAYNTFAGLQTGVACRADRVRVSKNTFFSCAYAGIEATSVQVGSGIDLEYNTMYLALTGSYNTYGILANGDVRCTGNSISGSNAGNSAYLQVGISYGSSDWLQVRASDNRLTTLDAGIEAPTDDFHGNTIDFTRNRLTDNGVGMAFYPWGNNNYGVTVTAYLKCNSFIDNGSVNSPIGIFLQPGAVITDGLGDPGQPGNGNEFQQGQWDGINQQPVVNNNGNSLYQLTYTRYGSPSESVTSIGGFPGGGVLYDNSTSVSGICGGSVGVNYRPLAAAPPRAAELQASLDSLRQASLPAQQQSQVLARIRQQPAQPEQYGVLESYLAPTAGPATTTQQGIALHLLSAYSAQHDQASTTRLRAWLDEHSRADDAELHAYLRLSPILERNPLWLPGLYLLLPATKTALQQVALSATTSARPACAILRRYEPTCACKLLPAAPAAARPTAARQRSVAAWAAPAYPNPATHTLHVPYSLPSGVNSAELVAYDGLGRVVLRQPVGEAQGEATLAVEQWAMGLYHLTLVANGQVLGSQRVAITHN